MLVAGVFRLSSGIQGIALIAPAATYGPDQGNAGLQLPAVDGDQVALVVEGVGLPGDDVEIVQRAGFVAVGGFLQRVTGCLDRGLLEPGLFG